MQTFTINNIKNETFTISSVDDLDGLNAVKNSLIANNKEPKVYTLDRIVTGRKQAYSVQCYRFAETGNFITII